jgi:hypothetical protein
MRQYIAAILRHETAGRIDKVAWGDYTAEYDFWALVGIPAETVHYEQENFNRFFARIKDRGTVNHLGGMSGGPVFALFKHEGRWRYKIIGLQSGWFRSDGVVSACPISSFAEELEAVVQEAFALWRVATTPERQEGPPQSAGRPED